MSGWWGLVAAAVGAPVSSSSSGGLSCRGEVRKTGRQSANRPTAALLRLTHCMLLMFQLLVLNSGVSQRW